MFFHYLRVVVYLLSDHVAYHGCHCWSLHSYHVCSANILRSLPSVVARVSGLPKGLGERRFFSLPSLPFPPRNAWYSGYKRRCYVTLGFVWTFSFLLSLLQLWWIQPTDYDPDESIPEEHLNKEVAYCIASLVVYLLAPTGFMAFTYLMTLREVRRQNRQQILNVPADLQEHRRWNKREGKAVTVFLVMFITHVACWLPFFLLRYQQAVDAFYLPDWAVYMIAYSRFVSPVLNPCLYIFGKHDFKKAWKDLFIFKNTDRDRTRSDLLMSSQLSLQSSITLFFKTQYF